MAFPLWVKQIIYLRLYQNLSESLSEDFIFTNENCMFQVYIPTLSFSGKTELVERKAGMDENIYNFLANVSEGMSMLEISMNNFWTMEEIAKYYIFCLDQNYIRTPESNFITAMAGFMAGKFRTGEYFKRTGKINVDQLEKAILTQKKTISEGKPMKIAEVMISLGFITEKDTTSLLLLKEEASKRFILDTNMVPQVASVTDDETEKLKTTIKKLTEQNSLLKAQLTKILTYIKSGKK
ncbi:hypothetical protein KBA27_04265 [bacterium]|nr:hypothetical protein [bacterium]